MNINFLTLDNFDLLTVGIAIAAIAILGFVVYYNKPNSITNKFFLVFSFFTILYGILNYISYKIASPFLILWFLRFTIFAAIWHAFSFFSLFYVFPKEKIAFGKNYKRIILPLVIISSILNLSPLAFSQLAEVGSAGQSSRGETGPAMALFGGLSLFLVIGGIAKIISSIRSTVKEEREQFRLILTGTVITFSLLLTFNMILPTVFNNVKFIPFAPLFILPFIAFTAYSIIKFHLFNTKIITTELLAFLLNVGILLEVVFSSNLTIAILRFLIFLMVLFVSILLIRSVRKEVSQREQLQKLSAELSEANVKLKALDQARSEFITIASHQLRTPPATIKWYLGAILAGDYGKVPKTIKEMLEKTTRTNNSLISLIDDMLNVSRIERGKMEFLFEETQVLALAELTVEQLIPMSKEKNLALNFERPKQPLPKIMADKEKLRQVMNNLIDNALKYTKQGSVNVKLYEAGEEIYFEVQDTGKGFSKEEGQEIFEKFKRGKESVRQSAGLGLGLYVAKVIIEQHKGKIWAESKGEGKGSCFVFSIPIHTDLKATTLLDLTK